MLNKVMLIGRVGKDPEIRELKEDRRMANFSLATSKKIKGEERTQWHQVSVFNKGLVGVIEKYVSKGDLIYIEGEIEYSKSEKDGQVKYFTNIVLGPFNSALSMLSSKGEKSGDDGSHDYPSNGGAMDDTIPF